MTEPTVQVQVPVSLIEEAAWVFQVTGRRAMEAKFRSLLDQPTPTPEPVTRQQRAQQVIDRNERNRLRSTPPSIADMVPGSDHPRAQPIGVVARSIVYTLLTEADSDDIALWEDYPEIGENDWDEVIAAARSLAPAPPSGEEYRAAYAVLDPSTIRDVRAPGQ